MTVSNRIHGFFDSYREAFERSDANAIVDHFTFPCHITSAADEVGLSAIQSRDEWRPQVERLLAAYAGLGVSSADVVAVTTRDLPPCVIQAGIDWQLHGLSGPLYDFHALYTLVDFGGQLKIAAIAHDEMPRLQDSMRQREQGQSHV